jgi:hypothetical protein
MKLLTRCAPLLLLCGFGTAFAQTPPPPAPSEHGHGQRAVQWCQENPEKCAEMKQRREAKCAENPQKCEEQRQRFEERRAQCAADPEKCKAERQQKMQDRRAKLQEDCADKPDGRACKRLQKLDKKLDAAGEQKS